MTGGGGHTALHYGGCLVNVAMLRTASQNRELPSPKWQQCREAFELGSNGCHAFFAGPGEVHFTYFTSTQSTQLHMCTHGINGNMKVSSIILTFTTHDTLTFPMLLELTRCYSEPTSLVSNPLVSHDPEFRKH
jgi:hypothetical protein